MCRASNYDEMESIADYTDTIIHMRAIWIAGVSFAYDSFWGL